MKQGLRVEKLELVQSVTKLLGYWYQIKLQEFKIIT